MLYSFIIPVYNVEKYIERCIKSVLEQTCLDYEVLLVDDGSTDSSGSLCDQYQEKYDFIKVIHQKNAGLANARNTGLDHAKGKYIIFLDSDDYIEKEFLIKVTTQMEEKKFDVCSFAARRITETEEAVYEMRFSDMVKEISFENESKERFLWKDFLQYRTGWEAWFFVYKREILENHRMRFDESIRYAEDLPFTFEYMFYVKNWVKMPDLIYNYTLRNSSITGKVDTEKMIVGMLVFDFSVMKKTLNSFYKNQESLLFASMLNYFIPHFLLDSTLEEIKKMLVEYTEFLQCCEKLLKDKENIMKIFGQEDTEKILSYAKYFVGR